MLQDGWESIDLDAVMGHFEEHGYARLGHVASDECLTKLRERANELMLGEVASPELFFQLDTESGNYDDLEFGKGYQGPSLNYRKIEKLETEASFREWLDNPLFERVARRVIEGDVALYRAILMNKAARGGTVLPWHQDGGRFWGLDRDPNLQIWTALDDAPIEAGCMEVLAGTHRDGLATPLGGKIPSWAVSAQNRERTPLPLPARAGEVLLIHNYLWHRSGVNATPHPRRAFSVCYMSASTRCLRKKKAPRKFPRVFATLPDSETA